MTSTPPPARGSRPREGRRVLEDLLGALLERHENATLVRKRATRQHLDAEDRLSRPRPAENDRDPGAREAAVGDRIETFYPGGHPAKRAPRIVSPLPSDGNVHATGR